MSSSYYITYGGNRLTFPGVTGSVAWEYNPTGIGVPLFIVGDANSHIYASAFSGGELLTAFDTMNSASAIIPTGSEIFCSSYANEYYRNGLSSDTGIGSFVYNTVTGRSQSASGILMGDSGVIGLENIRLNAWTATGSGNRTASSNLAVTAALVTRAFTGENVTAAVGSIGGNFLNKNSSACSAKLSGNLHYTGGSTQVTLDNQDWAAGKYSARRFGFNRSGASVGYMTGRLNATSTNANGAYNVTAAANNSTPPFSYYIGPTTAYYKPSLSKNLKMTATYTFTATGIAP